MAQIEGSAFDTKNPRASLYVGDLHPEVTESMLLAKFSTAGHVLSIRLCRDATTQRSLGYAFVNFQRQADAEYALETLNFDLVNGKPIRIMRCQLDPSTRCSGAGNIFIKNLPTDEHVNTKSIYATFSMYFGPILSCKLVHDADGKSKGYAFIQFETEEAAQQAIEKVNGTKMGGKTVFVGKFQPRAVRLQEMADQKFTNVYVKNFADKLDTDSLQELFSKFGEVLSCKVMCDLEGKSRGFGFVSYEHFEEAEKAVTEMDGKQLPGTELKLTVCRAQKKAERVAELKLRYDSLKEGMQRLPAVRIQKPAILGAIHGPAAEGFFIPGGLPVNQQQAAAQFMGGAAGQMAQMRIVPPRWNNFGGAGRAFNAMPQIGWGGPAMGGPPGMMGGPMPAGRAPCQLYGAGYTLNHYHPGSGGGPSGMGKGLFGQQPQGGRMEPPGIMGGQFQPMGIRGMRGQPISGYPQMVGSAGGPMGAGYYPTYGQQQSPQRRMMMSQAPTAEQQPMPPPPSLQAGIVVQNQGSIISHMLPSAQPQEQKQMLGEHLYSRIQRMCKDFDAGKITGMLLELDNSELLMMLESDELLQAKVNEAISVLNMA